jgi:hypothetical protein
LLEEAHHNFGRIQALLTVDVAFLKDLRGSEERGKKKVQVFLPSSRIAPSSKFHYCMQHSGQFLAILHVQKKKKKQITTE